LSEQLQEVISSLLVSAGAIEPFLDSLIVSAKENTSTSLPSSSTILENKTIFQLPTSPEIQLKKILFKYYKNSSGIYEIAHAFRNETLSKQHQLEFTMIEWYRNNSNLSELTKDILNIIQLISKHFNLQKKNSIKYYNFSDIFYLVYDVYPMADWKSENYLEICNESNISISLPDELKNSKKEIQEKWLLIQSYSVLIDMAILKISNSNEILFVTNFPYFVRGLSKITKNGWAKRTECFINGIEIANAYQEIDDPIELENVCNENNNLRVALQKEPYHIDKEFINSSLAMKNVAGIALGLERLLMGLFSIKDISSFF